MKSRREKYEENNKQLVLVVVKLREKVANLERKLIEQNRFAQNQYDENVALKLMLAEKETYAKMMQSSAIDFISHNTAQIQKFLFKTGLKIPSRHHKQANVQTVEKGPHINMEKKAEHGNGTCQHHSNEMPNSHQNEPIQLKVFQTLVDRTSSSLSKLSLASNDEQKNDSKSSNVTFQEKVQRKSFSMAGTMDDEMVSRLPMAKKQTYDDEVNESLRILKERKTGTSLATVPDESNGQSPIDLGQASKSNHSCVPFMPQTKVIRKRRSEIVPNLITPVKSLRSGTIFVRSHPDKSDSQNATDKEYASSSAYQNVFIGKRRKSEENNSHLMSPVDNIRSNTILALSPANKEVIKRSRTSHTPESSNDTHGKACRYQTISGRKRTPTQSKQTSVASRSRRSQTPVDYTKFFSNEKRQK